MFVCLCTGATSHVVNEVVANGAKTSKQIAEACGAGGDCGRCRRTLRAMIEAHYAVTAARRQKRKRRLALAGAHAGRRSQGRCQGTTAPSVSLV